MKHLINNQTLCEDLLLFARFSAAAGDTVGMNYYQNKAHEIIHIATGISNINDAVDFLIDVKGWKL